MILNPWTFLFEVVNFAILVFILRRILYAPLREAIDRRTAENDRIRREAEAARMEAEHLRAEAAARETELERLRQGVIEAARSEAEACREAILAEVEQAGRRRQQELEKALDAFRSDSLHHLRDDLIREAIGLADRLLREAADVSLDGQLTRGLIAALSQLSEEERARLRRDRQRGEAGIMESARPPDDDTVAQLNGAVADVLGEPVPLTFRVRPELIGGARLTVGGHVWDATLSGQLDEVRPAMPLDTKAER